MSTTTTGFATEFITFSRGSLATVTDSNGYIKWAPHNLLLASEQFDASSWTKTGYTVAANDIVAPNGTTTAEKITVSVGSAAEVYLRAFVVQPASTQITLSVFAKAGNVNFLRLRSLAIAGSPSAWFNLSTGALGTVGSGLTGSITNVGSGWYRCSITATTDTTVSFNLIDIGGSATDNSTAGVLNEFIYLWGAHLYRSDLGGMQANASAYPMYNPSTPKNLLPWSEDFSNAAWVKTNILAFGSGSIANAIAAPNGSLSADKIVSSTANNNHRVQWSSSGSIVSGTKYAFSFYAKAAEYSKVHIADAVYSVYSARFDLTGSGSVIASSGCTAAITAVGDGWYRCSAIYTAGGTVGWVHMSPYPDAGATFSVDGASYTGDGTSGIYLWGAQLSDSASLDPYSPVFGAAPSAAAAHGPRLDYDPSTLAAKGLLVEEQRTNLVLWSNEFDDVNWNKFNSTLTTNAATAPDGSATADLIVPNTTAGVPHSIYQSVTVSAVAYTLSVYAKAGGYPAIKVANLFTGVGATFNISTGVVGTADAGVTQAIRSVGNGWYRCEITFTASAGSTLYGVYVQSALGTSVYAGDGTSGVYLYGMQLEAGAFATSYIPTAAATVTRNADVASVATSQFPYSASEGTVVFNGSCLSSANTSKSAWELFLSGNERLIVQANDSLGSTRHLGFVGGSAVAIMDATAVQTFKDAMAYKLNDYAASLNGGSVLTDTSAAVPAAADVLRIGVGSGNYFNGHIRQITYIPRRLGNAELQARTV